MWEATVQHGFGSYGNVTGFSVTLAVTYSETDSVKFNGASVYNVRKLDFQANLCFTGPYCVNQSLSHTHIYEETSLSLV